MSLILSCADNPATLDISSRFWPEGSVLTVLREGKPVASSKLFGDRLTVRLPGPDIYQVRIAHPEFLTSLSQPIPVESGATAHMLPVPVSRRRIGSTMLYLGHSGADNDAVLRNLISTAPESFSGMSLCSAAGNTDVNMVMTAHEKAIEIISRHEKKDAEALSSIRKSVLKLIKDGVSGGVDGIECVFGNTAHSESKLIELVQELARNAHEQGMTFAIGFTPAFLEKCDPVALFKGDGVTCPDELILLCSPDPADPWENSESEVTRVESALQKMREKQIPLSRVSVEVILGAAAWEEKDGKEQAVTLKPGDLERVIAESGQGSVLRLNDGSRRLASRGITYAFEDIEGLSANVEFLRTGDLARVRSFRIIFDNVGIPPDSEGMRKLAAVFNRQ